MSHSDSTAQPPQDIETEERERWGRVLICGGTDWPHLGRKDKKGTSVDEHPDLLEPHVLRSLANVCIKSIHASGAGCHFVCIDTDGAAWLFGRNTPAALGKAQAGESASAHEPGTVSENAPRRIIPQNLGSSKGVTFVHAAVGRSHTLLVGSNGDVWSAGANSVGQCGQPPCSEVSAFTLVKGPWPGGEKAKIVKAAAGVNFSILLAENGQLFGLGSGEHGQVGNGRTGEYIATGNKMMYDVHSEPVLVKGLEGKVITNVACGHQHSIALDQDGYRYKSMAHGTDFEGPCFFQSMFTSLYEDWMSKAASATCCPLQTAFEYRFVYVWGYNGYCRLGLGNQQDVLIPKAVPQFAGPNELTRASFIVAGPSCSAVIDRQKMYWMAGKWKNSGEGSTGSPYSSFRYIQDIMGCKVFHASSGGVTHFALAPDDGDTVMTIAWGQNALNGELGYGPEEPKSSTKPTRHQPLIGIDVFEIAAGQNTTLFLARPNQKLSDLPRHPEQVDAPETCVVCNKETGDDDSPLECEKCDYPYHLGCLDPPLDAVPEGEWFCPQCSEKPGRPIGAELEEPPAPAGKKRRGKQESSGEEDDADEPVKRQRGKVPAKAPKRR